MGFVDDVRRTKNTFSDKNLEIVEQSDLDGMLRTLPDCRGVLLAGQLATQVFTSHFAIKTIPEMGDSTLPLLSRDVSFGSIACPVAHGLIPWP